MSKNFPSSNRKDLFDQMKPTASLIINSSKPLPLTPKSQKYQQESFPTDRNNIGIYRHSSEEELHRYGLRSYLASSDIQTKTEEYRKPVTPHEKAVALDAISKGMNKDAFFRGRAHQKIPISSSQGLGTHKSEKTLPSFLSANRKANMIKGLDKKTLNKNNFKIIRQMG